VVDAVVMDIEMPEVDGVEATQLLQEQHPDLPIIAISGHDYEERVFEIRDAGAQDYVRKSRVDEDLISALVALLRI
jgi:DNA-binding NarL/FixJ family response regulator